MSPQDVYTRRHKSFRQYRRASPPPRTFCFARMPSVFNIARAVIYATVLLWTVICLAIAVHLHGLLAASDLTRFIPFAIFVCSASLVIMLVLLGFTLMKDRNPISTRIELGCLGLAGTFWLALGAFLATSDSDTADVECFASADSTNNPIDIPGFSTETYQAQYRVLEAFSLFNTILLWGFFLLLLGLALRQHAMGHRSMWYCSVQSYPWFSRGKGKGNGSPKTLPQPVTGRSRSRGRSNEKKALGDQQPRRGRYTSWTPRSHKAPARAYLATDRYDKFKRGASPRASPERY